MAVIARAYIALVRLFFSAVCARIRGLHRKARRVRKEMAAWGVRENGWGGRSAGRRGGAASQLGGGIGLWEGLG